VPTLPDPSTSIPGKFINVRSLDARAEHPNLSWNNVRMPSVNVCRQIKGITPSWKRPYCSRAIYD
jgi:hypothetical protein